MTTFVLPTQDDLIAALATEIVKQRRNVTSLEASVHRLVSDEDPRILASRVTDLAGARKALAVLVEVYESATGVTFTEDRLQALVDYIGGRA